ncbi:hypothetical protein F0562_006924 [Nyssa sinensis]|uniref:NB-ARC domain-containing protein n=1 Tax=Nyssa sinensis TaxID=561372 RepID=A0A5J5A5W4_9ASTE|nr:hypothetical protein F0562_006924 [Nyssa sinensis]
MAADYLQFLKDKFIDDFKEAPEEFDEFPLHPRFQKILEVLQARNFSPATPLALKDPLYRLKFALAECIMFAEKERERKAQDKKDHFNVHSLKKRWFLYKTKKRLLKFEAKLCKTVDNEAVESSPLGLSMITVYETPSLFEPIFRPTIYGFDDQLQKIDELLFKTPDANSINVIGIVGMGGVGKSALAHEIFYKVQSEFDLKFWIRLSEKFNPENLESKIMYGT